MSICYISSHADNVILTFLGTTKCTFDESINGSFTQIKDYMHQNANRSWAIIILFGIILLVDVVGLVHKVQYEHGGKKDKYTKIPSDVEMKGPQEEKVEGNTI